MGKLSSLRACDHQSGWQYFLEVIWSMPLLLDHTIPKLMTGRAPHSLLLMHWQLLLLVQRLGCPEPALVVLLSPSVHLKSTPMLTKVLIVNWEFQLLDLI